MLDERGAKENLRVGFPTDRAPYTSHYDYENDSDLEEDYDDRPASAVMEKLRNCGVVVLEKSDVKNNESSDIPSISDLDSLFSEPSDTKDATGIVSSAHIGKVVVIEDVAFVT